MRAVYLMPAGAIALAVAAPAYAQERDIVDWSGPYVGGSLGYTFQKSDNNEHLRFDTDGDGNFNNVVTTRTGDNAFSPGTCGGAARGPTPASSCRGDRDGLSWMGHVGYDRQFGSIVAGVVVEAGKTYIDDAVSEYSTTPAFYTMNRKIDWNGNLRARLGYTTPGGIMPYVTGGLSYARVENSFTTSNAANSFTESNRKEDAWGWNLGGGLEAKVAPNFSIGARYLYTRYKANDYRVDVGAGTAPPTNPFLITPSGGTTIARGDKFDTQSVMVTSSIRF